MSGNIGGALLLFFKQKHRRTFEKTGFLFLIPLSFPPLTTPPFFSSPYSGLACVSGPLWRHRHLVAVSSGGIQGQASVDSARASASIGAKLDWYSCLKL